MSKSKRNSPCTCGSGLKYKNCCEAKEIQSKWDKVLEKRAQEEAQKLETNLQGEFPDSLYASVLFAVWNVLGPSDTRPDEPSIPEMERFFRDLYGHDLDRDALNKIVPPPSGDKLKDFIEFEISP
jgi:hypothetical protein